MSDLLNTPPAPGSSAGDAKSCFLQVPLDRMRLRHPDAMVRLCNDRVHGESIHIHGERCCIMIDRDPALGLWVATDILDGEEFTLHCELSLLAAYQRVMGY